MSSYQISIQGTDQGKYQWELTDAEGVHQAAGEAVLHPDTVITIRGVDITLSDLSNKFLHLSKHRDWFRAVFDDAGQLDFGAYLFQQTLAACWSSITVDEDLVELLVVSQDPYLQRLPWNLLSEDGKTFLVHDNCSINVAVRPYAAQISLNDTPRVLLVCPEAKGKNFKPTNGRQHAENLQQDFNRQDQSFNGDQYLSAVYTWDDFRAKLAAQEWDVVYFYGHGEGDRHSSKLIFADEQGKPELVSMLKMANLLRDRPPKVLYLNACQTGSEGIAGAVQQLGDVVPALVVNRTDAFTDAARQQAGEFLTRFLLEHLPPHRAITKAYQSGELGMSTTAWMTPLFFKHYASWTMPASGPMRFTDDPNWRLKLDRKSQFLR